MKVGLLVDITKDYEGSLRHAKELGFDRGQLAIWDMDFYTEENLQALKKLLRELDFTVTDLWCGWSGPMNWFYPEMYNTIGLAPEAYRAQRVEDLRRGARFAYELGVKNVVTHLGYVPDNPFDKDHRGVVEALRLLGSELKERGQTFALEAGDNIPLTLSAMICESGMDNIGINLDPANLIMDGRANPGEAVELFGSRVYGMHAKDGIPAKFGDPSGKEVPIGEGKADFENLIRKLKEVGYPGDITIEHEIYTRPDRDADIRKAKVYLESLIEKVFG